MHPLVARIHPALRVSFVAWLLTRSALVLSFMLAGRTLIPERSDVGLMQVIWWVVDLLNAQVSSIEHAGTWMLVVAGELAMAGAASAVFRFVRRDAMPHVAERATWLWCASPLMYFLPPGSPWCLALGAGLIGLEWVAGGKVLAGAALLSMGILVRPELALLIPGGFFLSWKTRRSDLDPWVALGLPVLAFSALVLGTVLLTDTPRALYEAGTWRQNWTPQVWLSSLDDLVVLGACLLAATLSISQLRRAPRAWLILALPLIAWPILQEPSAASAIPLMLGASIFGHLGLVTENPTFERPLLFSSTVAMVLLAFLA